MTGDGLSRRFDSHLEVSVSSGLRPSSVRRPITGCSRLIGDSSREPHRSLLFHVSHESRPPKRTELEMRKRNAIVARKLGDRNG